MAASSECRARRPSRANVRRRCAVASLVLLLLGGCSGPVPAPSWTPGVDTDVYLFIVDGLGARAARPARMPRLAAAVRRSRGTWLRSTAVMPTRTNPNHASLLTGVHADVHGITGNRVWSDARDRESADSRLLEVETLFTVIERHRPELVTAAAFTKAKLRRLFSAVPGRQSAPDVSWPPGGDVAWASDPRLMRRFRRIVRMFRPSLSVVAMGNVDRAGHSDGPGSLAYHNAVAEADRLIGTFVDHLMRTDRWRRSVVIVTSDHGFEELDRRRGATIDTRQIARAGVQVVCDGGLAFVHATQRSPERALRALGRATARARRQAAVAAVYGLTPDGPPVPPAPADWMLGHPRAGQLVLVAQPRFTFVAGKDDPARWFRGDHGGPGVRAVPLVILGGHPALRRARWLRPSSVDVAPTIARLLGLPLPERLDGAPIPLRSRGRVLEQVLRD